MTRPVRKLQIKLLSSSGELLNCVNCHAGQISVFRSSTTNELQPYLRALSGATGPERFVVELDGEIFNPQEHTMIGFGERFFGDEGNVSDFLILNGVPQFSVDSILLTFGLEKVAHTKCHLLSRCEERRVRLIAATYNATGVLVAHEPFDPISSEWREKFAEVIANFARSHKQIVVVPSLSYRPQFWIDNETVARIQVGENIQKTVGFGSAATDVQSLVNQVRELFKDPNAADQILRQSGSHPAPYASQSTGLAPGDRKSHDNIAIPSWNSPQTNEAVANDGRTDDEVSQPRSNRGTYWSPTIGRFLEKLSDIGISPRLASVASLALLVIVAASLWPSGRKAPEDSRQVSNLPATNPEISNQPQENVVPVTVQPGSSNEGGTPESKDPSAPVENQAVPEVPPQEPPKAFVLASYSPPIAQSVSEAFEGSGATGSTSAANQNSGSTSETTRQPSKQASEASDFLRLLQYAESSADKNETAPTYSDIPQPIAPGGSPYAEENLDEQERREAIRQKFLEAIQRAQERRGESPE